ncbi:MAG: methylated-DNA--[protein]-cysteine S-methyltransferase [Elusimicrobiota bacterium]|jgi:methylated-DNA-[protein]-cysteine S-methyltransferase|nr:methylated-DNA--[protein]-cysteine S-methyltransferase [Elusimicrobiota bacterium]
MKTYFIYASPAGPLAVTEEGGCISDIKFAGRFKPGEAVLKETPLLKKANKELQAYFDGRLKEFTLPLAPKGTAFQQKVWAALRRVPYGKTKSYKDIAVMIKNPKAMRAVGMANNRNPISIIVPCHRVIGANGSLTGYGGGLDKKKFLLALEAYFN